MSIDWNTAPEGATHWEPRSYDFAEGWMRKDGDGWSYWSEGREVWVRGVLTCDVSPEREATFEARPQDTEQIAAEEREKAIDAMLDLDPPYEDGFGMTSRRQFCEILFDAGYRRQEEGK
ncbi:TPA: hypothetical protein L4U29_004042 [Pseudomonas aeruginosa]|nr:hypothetical protein [Pseudomonas aeruginosa]